MYNCGPTVYKRQHIGNFRAFLMADLLRRTFEMLGLRVTQIMNITDVGHLTEDDVADASGEDKLQKEAARRSLDPWQIAREEEENFKADLAVLRIQPAHHYPRATDHVPEMIAMIETLIAKGHALPGGRQRLLRRALLRALRGPLGKHRRGALCRRLGSRRGPLGEAPLQRLRALEARPEAPHAVGLPLRARLPRLAHRVLRHGAQVPGRHPRHPHRRAGQQVSPITSARSHRASASRASPSCATGFTTAGCRSTARR